MTLEQWKSVAGLVESFAKIVALAVGGSWTYMLFIRKRQQYPRASVLHECAAYSLTSDRSLLRVTLTLKNTSEVLLRIESGEVRVQRIGPLVWGEDVPAEGFVADGAFEYNWPLLGRLRLSYPPDGCLEVEPGESEAIHFDAFVRSDVRVVQIYTYLKNVTKTEKEIGWNCTSIHQLVPGPKAEGIFE